MRMKFGRMAGGLLLAAVAVSASPSAAISQGPADEVFLHSSVLQIPARGNFPLAARVSIGLGKSVLVQFPFELKDVLVSSPDKVDAVVQASNRVFLIAKSLGQTNAFFFDTRGQQILTLEIAVGADLKSLDDMLKRFVPGLEYSHRDGRQGRRAVRHRAHAARRQARRRYRLPVRGCQRRSRRKWRRRRRNEFHQRLRQQPGRAVQGAIRGQDPAAGRCLRQSRPSWSSICSSSRARSR